MIKMEYYEVPRLMELATLYCDNCDVPMDIDDSKLFLSYPPQFEYKCPKCGMILLKSEAYGGNKQLSAWKKQKDKDKCR